MLTRRDILRSTGLLGAVAAASPLLSSCGNSNSAGNVPVEHAGYAGYAKTKVARYLGGSGARPDAVSAVQAFTVDLYKQLAAASTGNVICSPYSVALALSMTRNGARGRTADEMDAVLHVRADLARFNEGMNSLALLMDSRAGEYKLFGGSKATVSMDVANSLWGQLGEVWEGPFLDALSRYYGTGMRTVNYARDFDSARMAINEWTSQQTHEKIPHLLAPGMLDALTRLVLVNAIYLKAPWEVPFEKWGTRTRPFTLTDGRRVSPETMQHSMDVVITRGAEWTAVRLPYVGRKLAMTVVVPATSLQSVEQSLGTTSLSAMLSGDSKPQQVSLALPKWKFRLASPLKNTLTALGMPTAFDRSKADFSGMTRQDTLFIGAVQHEAYISVDEKGTEAAAATAVIMEAGGMPVPDPPFVVDRPFLFVIHDVDSATPLFIGRVLDPTAA